MGRRQRGLHGLQSHVAPLATYAVMSTPFTAGCLPIRWRPNRDHLEPVF